MVKNLLKDIAVVKTADTVLAESGGDGEADGFKLVLQQGRGSVYGSQSVVALTLLDQSLSHPHGGFLLFKVEGAIKDLAVYRWLSVI